MSHETSHQSEPIPSDPGVWRGRQAARYLGVSPDTLRIWRQRKHRARGPAFVRLGRIVRYLRGDLDAWLAANRVDPIALTTASPFEADPGDAGAVQEHGAVVGTSTSADV